MATTAAQVIDETISLVQGWAIDQSQSTTLTSPSGLSASGLSFLYDSSTTGSTGLGLSAGQVEIGRELIYVSNIDGTTATIPPWGRGYKSTTAASHPVNSRIISQPLFPRQKVLDVINQQMERIFPRVYSVRSFETTTTLPQITYELPDEAHWVLEAKWQIPDGRRYWQNIRRLRVSPGGGTQFGDDGVTVDVADVMPSGQPLQFLYAAKPHPLVDDTDDFVDTTGLTLGLVDVVELGAAAQLVASLESSRAQISTVEQQARSQVIAPSAALSASKYFDGRFQERLEEERKALQRLYPPRVTREWV